MKINNMKLLRVMAKNILSYSGSNGPVVLAFYSICVRLHICLVVSFDA